MRWAACAMRWAAYALFASVAVSAHEAVCPEGTYGTTETCTLAGCAACFGYDTDGSITYTCFDDKIKCCAGAAMTGQFPAPGKDRSVICESGQCCGFGRLTPGGVAQSQCCAKETTCCQGGSPDNPQVDCCGSQQVCCGQDGTNHTGPGSQAQCLTATSCPCPPDNPWCKHIGTS